MAMEQVQMALFIYIGLPILTIFVIGSVLAGTPILEILFGVIELIAEMLA